MAIHQPFKVLYDQRGLAEMLEWEEETPTPVGPRLMKYRLSRAEKAFASMLGLVLAVDAHNADEDRPDGALPEPRDAEGEKARAAAEARNDLAALREAKGRQVTNAYRKVSAWVEHGGIDDALREEMTLALREKEAGLKRQPS